MQEILLQVMLIALFAVGVGSIASMTGIGGGVINTPLLIIVFALSTQQAPATSLVAALFVAAASTYAYSKQNPSPIKVKPGLFMTLATVPGSLLGVALRELITQDYVLRLVFGFALFPIALKMLFTRRRENSGEAFHFDFKSVSKTRLAISLMAGFGCGIGSGVLGIGGGVGVVPALNIAMGLPIHSAVATSMFVMIFTAGAGTARNYIGGHINPFFALALGIGMVIGGQIGARLACRVDSVQLKRIFGLVLVFPLVKMMKLGQFWLDPLDQSLLVATIGDIIIWILIIIPVSIVRFVVMKRDSVPSMPPECESAPIIKTGESSG